jgi:hypothetical protein
LKEKAPATPVPLYLAHPFDSREFVRKWELAMEKKFPMIDFVNPFYDVKGRDDVIGIDEGRRERYKSDPKKIVIRDLEQISKAKGTVAVVDGSLSYGTIMEIAHSFLMNKPVYIIVTNGHIKHPWLQFHGNELFESFGDFEKYCVEQFGDAIKELKK